MRDAELTTAIRQVFHGRDKGRGVAGAREVWHLLRRDGVMVARCTVERLTRAAGLQGARRGRRFVTTRPDAAAARPPDLVGRDFYASASDRLWIVDFTYVPTWSGIGFTAFVSDVFSRRIVGWRAASSMPTQLPLDAVEMALWTPARAGYCDDQGRLDGLVHHFDAGSQYTAICYADRLADAGAVASIGTVGDSYRQRHGRERDRALQDRVRAPRRPVPRRRRPRARNLVLGALVRYRPDSAFDYATPVEHEQDYYRQNNSQQQPLPGEPALHRLGAVHFATGGPGGWPHSDG